MLLIRSGITCFEQLCEHDVFLVYGRVPALRCSEWVFFICGRGKSMKFIKKINNNVAFAQNQAGIDYIVLGKGLGFQAEAGTLIPEEAIDRSFKAEGDDEQSGSLTILTSMESEIVELTTRVSRFAEKELGIHFDNTHYLILADHLAYAIKRNREGVEYAPLNQWELRKLYPKEYTVAVEAIKMINREMAIELDSAETNFITNHFVNANTEYSTLSDTIKMTKLIKKIVTLVEYQFQLNLDEDSFDYNKFISHLRYFILRKMNDHMFAEETIDQELIDMFAMKYPEAYRMADKIEDLLILKEGWRLTSDEKLYLTVHVRRLTADKHN